LSLMIELWMEKHIVNLLMPNCFTRNDLER
jgi:hypothetical protein